MFSERAEYERFCASLYELFVKRAPRWLKAVQDREEAVAEAMFALVAMPSQRWAQICKPRAYAVGILRHKALDVLKRGQKQSKGLPDLSAIEADAMQSNAAEVVHEQDQWQQLTKRMASLKPRARMVLKLRIIQGWDYCSIEEVTGIKRKNLYVIVCRALKRLRTDENGGQR